MPPVATDVLEARFEACQQRDADERERTHTRLKALEDDVNTIKERLARMGGGMFVAQGLITLLTSAGGFALVKFFFN